MRDLDRQDYTLFQREVKEYGPFLAIFFTDLQNYKQGPYLLALMVIRNLTTIVQQILGAIAFYTICPLPPHWTLQFDRITRWAPVIGAGIGALLCALDWLFHLASLPTVLASVLIVFIEVYLTGGLHLDGAMDTADGLGVFDPNKRLSVMADSRTGAFGVMAAIALFSLKIAGLIAISRDRSFVLLMVPVWSRWGHVIAVHQYPYLKQTGKGAFHKRTLIPRWDLLPGSLSALIGMGMALFITENSLLWGLIGLSLGFIIPLLVIRWFYVRFQGMTGDIYGASHTLKTNVKPAND